MSERYVTGGGSHLQEALNAAEHGDRIVVADGVYEGCLVLPEEIGLTIESENGPSNCIIDAAISPGIPEGTKLYEYLITPSNPVNNRGNHVGFYGSKPCVYRPSAYIQTIYESPITIRGFTMRNGTSTFHFYDSGGARQWEGLFGACIHASKTNIDKCVIENCNGITSILRSAPTAFVDWSTVSNTIIRNCTVKAVYLGGVNGNEPGVIYSYRMYNCLMYGVQLTNASASNLMVSRGQCFDCTFDLSPSQPGSILGSLPGGPGYNFRNIATNIPLTGKWASSYTRGTISNCAVSGGRIDSINTNSEIDEAYRNRIVVLGEDFKLDSKYRPFPWSPLVGKGHTAYTTRDLAGHPRLNPPTIGCYELSGKRVQQTFPTRLFTVGTTELRPQKGYPLV